MKAHEPRHPPAPLTATVVIGAGTLASLGMSVITNKVYALVLGPAGVGIAALFLVMLSVGGLVASLGLGTSVVQAISASGTAIPDQRPREIERTARRMVLGMAALCALIALVLRDEIATIVFGTKAASPFVVFVVPAFVLTALAYVETGILTGRHRVAAVTATNVTTAGVGLLSGALGAITLGLAGLPPAMVITAATHYGFARLQVGAVQATAGRAIQGSRAVASGLARLGVTALASQLASAAAQLAVSIWVLEALGAVSVGFYRAAATISVGYLTLFLTALTYDFLPRVARVALADVGPSIDRLMRLILGLGLPIVVGLFASAPWLLSVLFSDEFSPALSVLQWQLVGDLLRIPAWCLSFALIARHKGGHYLALEGLVLAALLAAVPIGLAVGGLEGVGVGYAIAQAVYLAGAWTITARLGMTTPGRLQGLVVSVALAAAASIVIGLPLGLRGVAFGSLAVGLAAYALPKLYRLHRADAL